jgi:hypothetical protein
MRGYAESGMVALQEFLEVRREEAVRTAYCVYRVLHGQLLVAVGAVGWR